MWQKIWFIDANKKKLKFLFRNNHEFAKVLNTVGNPSTYDLEVGAGTYPHLQVLNQEGQNHLEDQ